MAPRREVVIAAVLPSTVAGTVALRLVDAAPSDDGYVRLVWGGKQCALERVMSVDTVWRDERVCVSAFQAMEPDEAPSTFVPALPAPLCWFPLVEPLVLTISGAIARDSTSLAGVLQTLPSPADLPPGAARSALAFRDANMHYGEGWQRSPSPVDVKPLGASIAVLPNPRKRRAADPAKRRVPASRAKKAAAPKVQEQQPESDSDDSDEVLDSSSSEDEEEDDVAGVEPDGDGGESADEADAAEDSGSEASMDDLTDSDDDVMPPSADAASDDSDGDDDD